MAVVYSSLGNRSSQGIQSVMDDNEGGIRENISNEYVLHAQRRVSSDEQRRMKSSMKLCTGKI